ncbi:hypothetical protein J8TS2_29580 [Lederbergia ruris]|uniref:Uncharacterized protein n=2 Tax=Lederbergia ruris TaxID=217495 RepID=A0ABQ4KL16_9BACI|nr:hypothetical protein J8TS2_29580 [Lederbergia ruris]
MQVIQYCHSNKIDVPNKLKVVGFEQPIAAMCEHAIHLISKSNEGEIMAKKRYFL